MYFDFHSLSITGLWAFQFCLLISLFTNMDLKGFLLCNAILPATLVVACPDLWIQVNDHCYLTSTDSLDWYESQQVGLHECQNLTVHMGKFIIIIIIFYLSQFCADQGGYLIEINDDDEQVNTKIYSTYHTLPKHHKCFCTIKASLFSFLSGDLNYWIGLADFATAGVWLRQHTYPAATYFYWASGEPNKHDGDGDYAPLGVVSPSTYVSHTEFADFIQCFSAQLLRWLGMMGTAIPTMLTATAFMLCVKRKMRNCWSNNEILIVDHHNKTRINLKEITKVTKLGI